MGIQHHTSYQLVMVVQKAENSYYLKMY